jgi:hypothetical protein
MTKSKYITVNGVKIDKTKVDDVRSYVCYPIFFMDSFSLKIIYKNGKSEFIEFDSNEELEFAYEFLSKAIKEYECIN